MTKLARGGHILGWLAVFLGLGALFGASALRAASPDRTFISFGDYFLAYEEVKYEEIDPVTKNVLVRRELPGVWRFILTQKPQGTFGLKNPDATMLTQPFLWQAFGQPPHTRISILQPPRSANPSNDMKSTLDHPKVKFETDKQSSRPVLRILKDDNKEVFSISPYSPDGLLSGLMIFGNQYSHVLGLGADFGLMGSSLNLNGQVSQVGGPSGNRLVNKMEGRTAGLQAPIMFALGQGKDCAAIFVNETRPLVWDFSSVPWTVGLVGPMDPLGSLEFFVIVGEDLPAIRRTYMSMVGRPPVPPKNIFRPWVVDRFRPNNSSDTVDAYFSGLKAQLNRFKAGVLALGLPVGGGPLVAAKAAGVDVMVIENPYVPVGEVFNGLASASRGYLVRDSSDTGAPLRLIYKGVASGLLDYTNNAASAHWHNIVRGEILENGFRTFFLDGGEPESYSALAWYKGDRGQGEHSHYAWANRFSLRWMAAFVRNSGQQRRVSPTGNAMTRLFMLARSGLAGQGRYGVGFYYMDPNPVFNLSEGLARSHLSLSGIDYFSPDIFPWLSRFSLRQSGPNFSAWLSRNALLSFPLLVPRVFLDLPWASSSLSLREKFEPYLYSLAHQAYLDGEPLVAPLVYHFQDDLKARDSAIEAMVGSHVLVAAGIFGSENSLSFTLPAGRWYDYYRREILERPETDKITLPSKLGGLPVAPLLLRAGAIIPLKSDELSLSDYLHIMAFPSQTETTFVWRDDDGVTDNYRGRAQGRGQRLLAQEQEQAQAQAEAAANQRASAPESAQEAGQEATSEPSSGGASSGSVRAQSDGAVSSYVPTQDPPMFTVQTRGHDQDPQIIAIAFNLTTGQEQGNPTYKLTINKAQPEQLAGVPPRKRPFIVEFVGVGNRGVATLDGFSLNREIRESDLMEAPKGWMSLGDGRVLVKTEPLPLNVNHVIFLR
ncbi:MAG: hypothetical protein LBT86_05855 [Deltaproteobacteria bacterium]|nr:hypothetical protein [Deltaproteobacteria bacterium]